MTADRLTAAELGDLERLRTVLRLASAAMDHMAGALNALGEEDDDGATTRAFAAVRAALAGKEDHE